MVQDQDPPSTTRELLRPGDRDRAEAVALFRQSRDLRDPELHLAWAELSADPGRALEDDSQPYQPVLVR